MSKTTEVEGIYWWKDNNGIWHICMEEDKIEAVINEYGIVGYKEKEDLK